MPENDKRVLVVDDDDAIRALLLTILRRRGIKVDTARNGAEAWERCLRCRYTVVLLDLMMPRMSGLEFLSEMRAMAVHERPTVFVLTAGTVPRHFDADVVSAVFRKPFDIEMLVEGVTACLRAADGKSQMESCPPAESDGAARRSEEPN